MAYVGELAGRGDAGRTLPGEVVGLLRRSALSDAWPRECTAPVVGRVRGLVLDPGERCADQVLAELPGLGEPWCGLVEHALAARVGRPSAAWDRRALALAHPLGEEAVRRRVTSWLELAAEGGGRDDGASDPYNLPALAGLAWLLSLLPPHPESVRVLGARGLGQSELERLSTRVAHKVTRRQTGEVLEP